MTNKMLIDDQTLTEAMVEMNKGVSLRDILRSDEFEDQVNQQLDRELDGERWDSDVDEELLGIQYHVLTNLATDRNCEDELEYVPNPETHPDEFVEFLENELHPEQ